MKRLLVLLLLFSLTLTGCMNVNRSDIENEIKNQQEFESNDVILSNLDTESSIINANAKMADVPVIQEKQEDVNTEMAANQDQFVMIARVTGINDHIAVEVIESPYATGTYWVVTSSDTLFYDKTGNEITGLDISVGDIVSLVYTGQVMLSLPPQIIALSITKQ